MVLKKILSSLTHGEHFGSLQLFFPHLLNFNFISRKKLELSFLFSGGEIGLISGIQIAPLHTPNWASSFPWYPHVEMGGIFISSRLPEGLNTPSHDALLVWFDQRTVVWFPSCCFHSRDRSRTSSRPSPHCTSIPKSSRVSSLFFTSLLSLSLPSLILRKKLLFASFDLAFFYPVFWRWIPKCMREEPVRWRLTELWNAVWREASSLFKKESKLLLFNIFSHFLNCLFPFFDSGGNKSSV